MRILLRLLFCSFIVPCVTIPALAEYSGCESTADAVTEILTYPALLYHYLDTAPSHCMALSAAPAIEYSWREYGCSFGDDDVKDIWLQYGGMQGVLAMHYGYIEAPDVEIDVDVDRVDEGGRASPAKKGMYVSHAWTLTWRGSDYSQSAWNGRFQGVTYGVVTMQEDLWWEDEDDNLHDDLWICGPCPNWAEEYYCGQAPIPLGEGRFLYHRYYNVGAYLAHELGHALGMADRASWSCSNSIMDFAGPFTFEWDKFQDGNLPVSDSASSAPDYKQIDFMYKVGSIAEGRAPNSMGVDAEEALVLRARRTEEWP